ncbi:hypothetical protein PO124_15790 [Bacillus licheniformis]|nr:hypothetical protein [Bacillus licheniformis]
MYELLVDIPGLTCLKPEGAFYLFPNAKKRQNRAAFQALMNSPKRFGRRKVAIVPGSGFGAPDNIRLSYATSLSLWKKRLNASAALS